MKARLLACWLTLLCSLVAHAADHWLPLKDVSLIIAPDSILDFSKINTEPAPLTTMLIVNKDGHFANQAAPDKPLHFLMGSLGFGISNGGFPSHTLADLYVRQFRMHGYNMARLDFIEQTLMNERVNDFDFDPEQFDRLNYLLAALKREGIYYMLNGLSSGNGGYGNIKNRWIDQRHLELGIYYDVSQQNHWKKLMEKLFLPINPYTGISTLNDPALAGLIMVNEGGLAFINRNGVADALRPQFASWLKKKYGSTVALSNAWKGELGASESIEAQSVAFARPDAWTSQRMADTQQFFVDLEKSTAGWMMQYMRQLGYQGMLTAYNNWLSPAAAVSRAQFDWVDMHNYFAIPTDNADPGSVMRQDSVLQDGAGYIRDLALNRHIGKGFSVSEFGQVFWNQYRRESGLAMAAYAGFQGWDVICQHANAVALSYIEPQGHKDNIGPFDVGVDPIARASETLAALLFMRGDVSPATHMLGVKLTSEFVFYQNAHIGNMPGDISRLALINGIGLDWLGSKQNTTAYDAQIEPGNSNLILKGKPANTLGNSPSGLIAKVDSLAREYAGKIGHKLGNTKIMVDDRWVSRVEALRRNGFISPNNLTDATQGIYQSDTGQITMDSQARRLTVITPNTEAVVFDTPQSITLKNLSLEQADGAALVSVSSMDGQPLQRSQRMLLILATDARNSEMHFADDAETTLQDIGKKPVVIRTMVVKVHLKTANKLTVFSTNLRGQRMDAIPVTQEAGGMSVVLDTNTLSHGPTTYFEIVAQHSP